MSAIPKSPQKRINFNPLESLLEKRNEALKTKNRLQAASQHKGIFKICFIFTIKSRLKMLESFTLIKKLQQYYQASLKNRQLFHIPMDRLKTFSSTKRQQFIFLVFLFSKMAEKMRFCLMSLRNKLRSSKENKNDKIYRCWHIMKNIGAQRIYRIYLRRHGIEKQEKYFNKWKKEARFREIFGKHQEFFNNQKKPQTQMTSSYFQEEDLELDQSSDSDSNKEDGLMKSDFVFRDKREGLQDEGLGQLLLQKFRNGGNGNVHDDYVERVIKEHKRATAHLNQSKVKLNVNLASKIKEVKLTRGDLCQIIKENVTKLKTQNKQALQDAVDFGDFEGFSHRFVNMTLDFFTGLKTHSEIMKNKKMKKMQVQLRQKMYNHNEKG